VRTKIAAILFTVVIATLTAGLALGAVAPAALDLSLGVSTADSAPFQASAFVSGGLTDVVGYRIGGWLVTGSGDTHSFLADAYLDFKGPRFYVAAGQKFVPFGPAGGVLVSPGIRGAEAKLDLPGVAVQVTTGRTEFTPVTGGGPRFTPSPLFPAGAVRPEEDMTAARAELALTPLNRVIPVKVGVNLLDTLDDIGWSGDGEFTFLPALKGFVEFARFRSVSAWAAGVQLTDLRKAFGTKRATSGVLFYRRIPDDYAPAVVGATQYFPGQRGLAAGVYHELKPGRTGVGLFADEEDAILTLFKHFPLVGR